MQSVSPSESVAVYSTEILLNATTIREVNSTAIIFFCLKLCGKRNQELRAIAVPSYKQPNKLSQLQNFKREEVAFDYYRWFTHENWPICLCLFRYATSGGVVWLDCRRTKHQSSGPEAKAGTRLRDHCLGGAMETDAKPTSWKRGGLQASWG